MILKNREDATIYMLYLVCPIFVKVLECSQPLARDQLTLYAVYSLVHRYINSVSESDLWF